MKNTPLSRTLSRDLPSSKEESMTSSLNSEQLRNETMFDQSYEESTSNEDRNLARQDSIPNEYLDVNKRRVPPTRSIARSQFTIWEENSLDNREVIKFILSMWSTWTTHCWHTSTCGVNALDGFYKNFKLVFLTKTAMEAVVTLLKTKKITP